MLISNNSLIDRIGATILESHITSSEKAAYVVVQNFLDKYNDKEIYQIDKPSIVIDEKEKAVIIYCNDALFSYIKELQGKDFESMNTITLLKVWGQIKKIFDTPKIEKEKGK